jgi:hypothetical protein
MGINRQIVKTLLFENSHKPFSGDGLIIGRSTVVVSYPYLEEIFGKFELSPPPRTLEKQITKYQSSEYDVDDKVLFSTLSPSIESIGVLDISDYEGADIVWDLNKAVPKILHSSFDFVYDSSVIDNIFNPGQGISNIHSLLKPGGRYIGINMNSFFPGSMVSCHPEWFYSFFAVNGYSDVKVYLTEQIHEKNGRFEFPTNLFRYQPNYTRKDNYNYLDAVKSTNGVYRSIIIAEKNTSPKSEDTKYPVNLQYIDSSKGDDWSQMEDIFVKSNRPVISSDDKRLFDPDKLKLNIKLPHLSDHYIFLGSKF